jgi:hypothetical protein
MEVASTRVLAGSNFIKISFGFKSEAGGLLAGLKRQAGYLASSPIKLNLVNHPLIR